MIVLNGSQLIGDGFHYFMYINVYFHTAFYCLHASSVFKYGKGTKFHFEMSA